MKRVNLVGNYKQEVSPCEMEDILVFSKMAHIIPKFGETYLPLNVWLIAKNSSPKKFIGGRLQIVRWQFVEDQNGNLILAYRARRIDGIPNVYELLYGKPCLFSSGHWGCNYRPGSSHDCPQSGNRFLSGTACSGSDRWREGFCPSA